MQAQAIPLIQIDTRNQEQAITSLKTWIAFYSLVLSDFPPLFDEFLSNRFVFLWRGSCNGFGAENFHGRCDGHANALTLIFDTGRNVSGDFTPLHWDSNHQTKCDENLKDFLFMLKNPHNTPARKFALNAEQDAIDC
jgi:hypothetical protein